MARKTIGSSSAQAATGIGGGAQSKSGSGSQHNHSRHHRKGSATGGTSASKNALSSRSSGSNSGTSHYHHHHHHDPATLLARGYTARWLGVVGGGNPKYALQPLSQDEIEQDLRHMNAFYTACLRYQQHAYAHANRATLNAAANATNANSKEPQPNQQLQFPLSQQLPIRLDPDHEKRLQAQRQRLVQAELIREALEQQYVAVRAHYVEMCQHVKQVAAQKQTIWLQTVACQQKAKQLAYLRARVQITRDVANALQYRTRVLQQVPYHENPPRAMSMETDQEDPLLQAWSIMEQAAKDLSAALASTSKSNKDSDNNNSNNNNNYSKQSIIPWPARVVPATPFAVPLMVSTASTAPEKSVAWACEGDPPLWAPAKVAKTATNYCNESPLVWMRYQLPATVGDLIKEEDEDDHPIDKDPHSNAGQGGPPQEPDSSSVAWLLEHSEDGQQVVELRHEYAALVQELATEGQRNATCLQDTSKYRRHLDEWTSMISLLRQETEAVLYRHNVLLSSPEVADRAASHWEDHGDDDVDATHNVDGAIEHHEQELEEEEDDVEEEEEVDDVARSPRAEEGAGVLSVLAAAAASSSGAPTSTTAPQDDDGANDGDDEGDDEGGEQQDNWGEDTAGGTNNKRANSEDSPAGTRKKRKV